MKAGWEVKPLERCIEPFKISGKIPRKKFEADGPFPIVSQEADYINGYWSSRAELNRIAKPVVIFGDHTQVIKYIDFDFVVGADGVKILQPVEKLNARFLAYFLEGNPIPSLGYARHFRHIKGLEIPIPPLEEQKRIVAVLDEAFEGLIRAKENAEANLQNARELFENAELEIFRKHTSDVPSTTLGSHADFRNGLNFSKSSVGQTVKIVGVGDFQDNFWMPLEQLKTVAIEGELSEQDSIQTGDILAVRSNGNKELIGRVMLAGSVTEPTSFSGFTIRIRITDKHTLPEFICYFMKTKAMRKLLAAGGDGANISNLNQKLLSGLSLRVPSKSVQRAVIEEAKNLKGSFDELTASYLTKLQDIADLRQSLLQKAFAGDLT